MATQRPSKAAAAAAGDVAAATTPQPTGRIRFSWPARSGSGTALAAAEPVYVVLTASATRLDRRGTLRRCAAAIAGDVQS
jgi:hypothetical protein